VIGCALGAGTLTVILIVFVPLSPSTTVASSIVSAGGLTPKVAVTARFAFMTRSHAPVPAQSPDQEENSDPADAVAVSATAAPQA
jgi:hypothetical protein